MYAANKIAACLLDQGVTERAAKTAGRDIADAWNDRYFFTSYTRKPLEKCLLDSPAMNCTADQLMATLVRAFEVFVHDVPEWEPKR